MLYVFQMVSSFKENLFASIIAIFLAFVVVFAINNNSYLFMNIQKQVTDASFVDFVVEVNNDNLILKTNKDISWLQILFVRLNWDVKPTDIVSKYDYLSEQIDNMTNLMFMIKSLKKWDEIFKVKKTDVGIDDIKLMFTDGQLDTNVLFK